MSLIKRIANHVFHAKSLHDAERVFQLSDSVLSNDIAGIRTAIIEHGVDPNVDLGREKLLHMAARSSELATIKTLVELGANPLAVDSNGLRPSFHAYGLGRTEIGDYLEEAETAELARRGIFSPKPHHPCP